MDAAAHAETPARGRPLRLHVDGRLVLAAVLVAYGIALFWPHLTNTTPHWTRVGVLNSTWSFADMREITSSWECVRKGQQVIIHDYCDPIGWRPANFPQLWVRLSFLGLGQGATNALGIGVAVLFLGSVFLLTGPLSIVEGLLWGALVASPSIMLGVDRANVDLLLFAMLVLALLAFARAGPRMRALGCAVLELAAWLKLFPIFATGAVLHWRRRPALIALAALTLVFGGYALVIWHEIQTIRSVVPGGIELSFGAGVIVDALRVKYGPSNAVIHDRPEAIALLGLFTLAVAVVAALLLRRRQRDRTEEADPSTRLPWLWAGAGIVVGCWVFTENSFDYRLAFSLLAVPQLVEWARQRKPAMPLAGTSLVLLVATLWLSDTQPVLWSGIDTPWRNAEAVFPFDEVLVWCLVVYFTVALLRTLPAWVTQPEPPLATETATARAGTARSEAGSDHALTLFEEATSRYRSGDNEGAIAGYRDVAARYGFDDGLREIVCGARLNLGLALEKAGHRAEAEAAYLAVIEQFDPGESDYIRTCVKQARRLRRTRRLHGRFGRP